MELFKRFAPWAALGLLLSISLHLHADEIQDANKLFKQGQLPQALEKVNGVLASKPKDAQARFLKGLIVNEQGNAVEAIAIFTELTNDYPELPEPYNNLAVLYAGQGQYEKAKVALEMAIRTHPSYATAHENLGDIYAKMASQAYDRALQLDKNNTGTQTKLALIRDLFGKGATKTKAAPSALAESSPAQPGSPVQASVGAPAKPQPATPAPMVVAAAPAPIPLVPTAQPALKPAVPATPAAKVPTPAPAPDIGAEIQQATRDWAAAWAAKNVKRYLAFYAPEFKTPNGESRAAWEKQRKERISKPKSIKVEVANLKVEIIDATHANISFRQTYNASHFKSANNKTLVWVKTAGGWKIADEQSSN